MDTEKRADAAALSRPFRFNPAVLQQGKIQLIKTQGKLVPRSCHKLKVKS